MFRVPTVVSLLLLALPKAVFSSPCVTFDASFNLLAFGLDGKDWNAGTQDTWTSGQFFFLQSGCRVPRKDVLIMSSLLACRQRYGYHCQRKTVSLTNK